MRNMVTFVLILITTIAIADSVEFEPCTPRIVSSDNGRYYVKLQCEIPGLSTDSQHASAFKVIDGDRDSLIWKISAPRSGRILLSNDGRRFIFANEFSVLPFEISEPALSVYYDGVFKRSYPYSMFVVDPTQINTSVSLYSAISNIFYSSTEESVSFLTCDNLAYSVDLTSGDVRYIGKIRLPFGVFKRLEVSRLQMRDGAYLMIATAGVISGAFFTLLTLLCWRLFQRMRR